MEEIALVAILDGQNRLSPESLIIINLTDKPTVLRQVALLQSPQLLIVRLDPSRISLKHLNIRHIEMHELFLLYVQG